MKEAINCKTKSSGMLILLAMFYGIVMICPGTVANKLVGIHGIIFAAGSLVLPLLFWLAYKNYNIDIQTNTPFCSARTKL